jgi:hypothetical protein
VLTESNSEVSHASYRTAPEGRVVVGPTRREVSDSVVGD